MQIGRLLLFSLFLLVSCAPAQVPQGSPEQPYPPPHEPQVGDILHLPTGTYVSAAELAANAVRSRVVFVGETHDNPASHRLQEEILKALQQANPGHITLAMEMFTPRQQPVLDLWSAGRLSEKEFLRQVDWYDTWRINFSFYRPLLDYCRDQRIKVLALNAPEDLKQKVSRTPFSELSAEDRARLPQLDEADPYQRAMATAVFADHKMGQAMLDGFLRVQTLWDETMAENLANYLRGQDERQQALVVAGGNHIRYGYGIPRRLFRRLPVSYVLVGSTEIDIPADKRDRLMNVTKPELPMLPYQYLLYTAYEDLPEPGVKLGISFEKMSSGIIVKGVMPGSAAAEAGLQPEDLILKLDDEEIVEPFDLVYPLQLKQPGDAAELLILRGGRQLHKEVTFSTENQAAHAGAGPGQ